MIKSQPAEPRPQQTQTATATIGGSIATPGVLGGYTTVSSSGSFPSAGGVLGNYFSMGRLGKGTFCSIHRCVNLRHYHTLSNGTHRDGIETRHSKPTSTDSRTGTTHQDATASDTVGGKRNEQQESKRVVAAKLEIGEFQNSGVLAGEAAMLEFLDASLPKDTVPVYMGHLREKSGNIAAIIMEYLPGKDMHQIRDATTRGKTRRLAVEDAVYLTADVMLPLLQHMHSVGIVHRDVKPSNCVKRTGNQFAMVDFGLSKSIVVPRDSPLADPDHPWKGRNWMKPPSCNISGHYRMERTTADFRGTSMYASLRIHQLRDYSPRDDMWSLMYVFCDLVSGGLPWMSHAANKDRTACSKMKERIHGQAKDTPHATHELLQGYDYHIAKARLLRGGSGHVDESQLPKPLDMSKDPALVQLLQHAFSHLLSLSFFDMPDYDLLRRCLHGFLDARSLDRNDNITAIVWDRKQSASDTNNQNQNDNRTSVPAWKLLDHDEHLTPQQFARAERLAEAEQYEEQAAVTTGGNTGYDVHAGSTTNEDRADDNGGGGNSDHKRLPLELQFRLAQVEYNTKHHDTIPLHIALHDWMQPSLYLLHGEWDSRRFEKGGHRRNEDNFRRENYLRAVQICLRCANQFSNFKQRDAVYDLRAGASDRLRIDANMGVDTLAYAKPVDLVMISRTLFGLRRAKRKEENKKFAPPPILSFGSG